MLTPDYIRVGHRVCVVTWPRLLGALSLCALYALLSGGGEGALPAHGGGGGGVLARAAASVVEGVRGGGARARGARGGGAGSGAARKPLTGLMRSFCAAPRAAAAAAAAPAAGWVPARAAEGETPEALCEWAAAATNKAAVPFRSCTFPRAADSQVSTYVHREGYWNEWRMRLVEDMLPVLDSADAWAAADGRSLVIDIGSNIGFYALLFAARGYDVVSVEPLAGAAVRQTFSLAEARVHVATAAGAGAAPAQVEPFAALEAAQAAAWAARDARAGLKGGAKLVAAGKALGSKVARAFGGARAAGAGAGGGDGGGAPPPPPGDGRTRAATAWVFQNAAGDAFEARELGVYEGNPGATWVPPVGEGKGGPAVAVAPVDDLLAPGARDAAAAGGGWPGLAVEPERVRLVKVSAEQMDSRAVSGMRRLLSVGRVPFVLFVFNAAHVASQGCDAAELVGALVDHGYRLYHAGIWYERAVDVARFLKGQVNGGSPRSTELVFVHATAAWA